MSHFLVIVAQVSLWVRHCRHHDLSVEKRFSPAGQLGEKFLYESVLGTLFSGRLLETTTVAGREAVVPEIAGRAFITGMGQQVVEPDDPLQTGYTVSDIWS